MNAAVLEAETLRPLPDCGALSLRVGAGRLVCLLGPAGGGKSLWLRALAGVDPPAAGRLEILGVNVERLNADAWRQLRRRAGFVPTGAPLLSVSSGLANVMLPALYHGTVREPQARSQALEILAYLGYQGPTDKLPAYLHPHERLLLAIARCLMLSPQLLFLDEPFYMTDELHRRREAALYRRLARERGLAMFVATHNLGFAKRAADDILFIRRGAVQHFAGWPAFADSGQPEVRAFLDGTEAT